MSRRFYRDGIGTWRIEFIQPAIPGSDLFGLEGEIVGPMTMQLAEDWIDHFDYDRFVRRHWAEALRVRASEASNGLRQPLNS